MRGRSSGKTAPPVPGHTRVGGGAIILLLHFPPPFLPTFFYRGLTSGIQTRFRHRRHPTYRPRKIKKKEQ